MSLVDEPKPWAKYNVPGYNDANTTTATSMPDDVMPKRARISEEPQFEDFDSSTVPPATEIDFSNVKSDKDHAGFNPYYYYFKCPDPENPEKSMFIKHNEIPLLLKKGFDEKCYLLHQGYYDHKAQAVPMYGIFVVRNNKTKQYELKFMKHNAYESQPLKTTKEMADVMEKGTKLWANERVRVPYNDNYQDKYYVTLYLMGVKYQNRCTYDLMKNIERVSIQHDQNRSKEYYQRSISTRKDNIQSYDKEIRQSQERIQKLQKQKDDMEKGIQKDAFYQRVKAISARIAYLKNAHPEDEEIEKEAKKEASKQ